MAFDLSKLCDIQSESGIIASLIYHPDFIFHSEQLTSKHFSSLENGFIYYAISELAKKGTEKIDAYGINMLLSTNKYTKEKSNTISVETLNQIVELGKIVARSNVEEYLLLVKNVMDLSFRRETYNKLQESECMTFDLNETDIQEKIYNQIEEIICNYQDLEPVDLMKNKIDDIWERISSVENQDNFIDFKFPTLNRYCKISKTDAIIFAAREKRGKSIMLLNCLVDLLKKDKKILYIDSELSTDLSGAP